MVFNLIVNKALFTRKKFRTPNVFCLFKQTFERRKFLAYINETKKRSGYEIFALCKQGLNLL